MTILTATLRDGTPIILDASRSREQLKLWRTDRTFHCPQCKERVILKVGTVRIPHFAHLSDSDCRSSFSEGESADHLMGKQLLYTLFSRLGKQPELEPFLPELSQRPDLLIRHGDQAAAIEFQCSRIAPDLQQSRSAGYESIGMAPIWMLRTPPKYEARPAGVDVLSFTSFHQQFFSSSISPNDTLLTFSPRPHQFHYFSHLLHMEGNRFLCVHRCLPLHLQTFPFARPKPPDETLLERYRSCYQMHRTAFLQRALFVSRKGVQDPFLRNCYEMRLHPADMPARIGVPVRNQSAFAVHDCAWQLDLTISLKRWQLPLSRVPVNRLRQFVHRYPGNSDRQTDACIAYLQFLQRISVKGSGGQTKKGMEQEFMSLLSDHFLANQIEN
ncbi:hypothetical protein NCCP2716_00720 [Sporosarcina sp. NCCP-2716]|uniref:competence protein CoiA n=1 Tax=Sporosarcina sp. NCCP-2716 TaxID=2943679 RepID=UPI00204152CF|nr:competence protein CoiA family protein [Sporosarcina sp. NCCP-2716]GKV67574.1 hypothetical protein NCCP2716_00720 [Sporosarcina sp. NCCP-2716]